MSALSIFGRRVRLPAVFVPGAVVLEERALTVLPARRPVKSEIARSFRERGFAIFRGTVSGWTEQDGQSYVPIQISAPDLQRATQTTGMAGVTINFDEDAARYLPPRQRVEIAIRIVGEDEDDDGK
jgi:hypothetical protein